MRVLHTSDWQIGKAFGQADEVAQVLRDERLDAISRLGAAARAHGAAAVLVAGDVYDVQTPSDRTLRQPIERMRAFPDLVWHLIPGNHDPHSPRGPWERLLALPGGLPAQVRLHLTPAPAEIAPGTWLLPAVLTRQHAQGDPTAAFDAMPTPEGALRIGLAHGSITEFGNDESSTHNLIAFDRAKRAGLAYLALGDWHRAPIVIERTAYSGTPEADEFPRAGQPPRGGHALLVDVAGAGAPPVVQTLATGRFAWHRVDATLDGAPAIAALEARLRALGPDLGQVLVWLTARGTLSLPELDQFDQQIRAGLGSALRVLRLADEALLPRPTSADLETIDHAGFVRDAADALALAAAGEGEPAALAAAALHRLYLLSRMAGGRG